MNPLMQAMTGSRDPMGNMSKVAAMMRTLRGGNPEQIAMQMMQSNPQFRQFVQENQGKTPQQIAQENGIDLNQIMGMIG